MKAKMASLRARIALAALALLPVAALLSACATTKPVDWNSRIGSFTYDQAVTELGAPDKCTQLSDGRTVAEWTTRRAGRSALSVGIGYGSGSSAFGVGQSLTAPEQVLRLTFGADGKLAEWKKLTR